MSVEVVDIAIRFYFICKIKRIMKVVSTRENLVFISGVTVIVKYWIYCVRLWYVRSPSEMRNNQIRIEFMAAKNWGRNTKIRRLSCNRE